MTHCSCLLLTTLVKKDPHYVPVIVKTDNAHTCQIPLECSLDLNNNNDDDDNNNNDDDDHNNNTNRKSIFLQSPHCAANCLQHVCLSGWAQSCARHRELITCNMPRATYYNCLLVGCLTSQQHASVSQGRICSDNFHVLQRDSSAIKLDRVSVALI